MILAVLPFRLESSRIPKKMLADIKGKSLALRSFERAKLALGGDSRIKILAAVDSKEVQDEFKKHCPEAEVFFTDPNLPSGTDRVFAAAKIYLKQNKIPDRDIKGILNIQGDMPFMGAKGLHSIAMALLENSSPKAIFTLSQSWPPNENISNLGAVKVLCDQTRKALYFSRFPIPHSKIAATASSIYCELHLGVYGYTLEALSDFCSATPSDFEKAESLEQLRALYIGLPIQVLKIEVEKNASYRGVDLPEDLEWARGFSSSSG